MGIFIIMSVRRKIGSSIIEECSLSETGAYWPAGDEVLEAVRRGDFAAWKNQSGRKGWIEHSGYEFALVNLRD